MRPRTQYFLGGDIKKLHAVVGQTNEYGIEVEGDVVARLEFANGARGLFFATNNNWTNESVQIRVAMEKGVFHIEDNTLYKIEAAPPFSEGPVLLIVSC